MNEDRLKDVFSDQEFMKELFQLETAEDVQKALAEQGVELSISDIELIRKTILAVEEELADEELEGVSGGIAIGTAIAIAGLAIAAAQLLLGAAEFTDNKTRGRW